jgi:hypothetical protein
MSSIPFVPYICSEIFFNDIPDDTFTFPIASFCNDTWIEAHNLERIMHLIHTFRALEWMRDILYVSYNNPLLYDKSGVSWKPIT